MFSLPVAQAKPGLVFPKQSRTHLSVELCDVRPLLREVEQLERDKGRDQKSEWEEAGRGSPSPVVRGLATDQP